MWRRTLTVGVYAAVPMATLALACVTRNPAGAPPLSETMVGQPAQGEASAAELAAFEQAAKYSEELSGRALLVMRDGKVLFERYADGWTAERPHPLASGTKSFTGTLAMCAVEDGLIKSLDDRVSDVLTEWKGDPRKERITVRQLLTLSSGLSPDDDSLGAAGVGIRDLGGGSALAGLRRTPEDRFAAAIGVPAVGEPGAKFEYGPSHFYAFGAYLQRVLEKSGRAEKSYWEYLSARLLTPIGIGVKIDRFAPDQKGQPNLPGGGHFTAREWAKFGQFVVDGGRVRGEGGMLTPVLAKERLDECFKPSERMSTYGLTWWLLTGSNGDVAKVADDAGRMRSRAMREAAQLVQIKDKTGKPVQISMAAGAGKQRLYVLPEQGMVVVRFAKMGREGQKYSDVEFLRLLLANTAERTTGGVAETDTPASK